MRVLLVHTYYPEFLGDLYDRNPRLVTLDFDAQRQQIFRTRFGVSDAYSNGLQQAGIDAQEVICNADVLQLQWANERGLDLTGNIHDQRRQILAAQVSEIDPDVLYVFEWSPLGDAFLAEMKDRVPLLVGQIASPLPPNRSFEAYDVLVSSWKPIIDYTKREGRGAAHLRLAFDARVLDELPDLRTNQPAAPKYEVTFVGGFAPSHPDRIDWLERVMDRVPVTVFGYGEEHAAIRSPVRANHRGQCWGLEMYQVLADSKVTLNRHAVIDVRGAVDRSLANNMRLYEAGGVGACLVTDAKSDLAEILTPGKEVIAYETTDECIESIAHLLSSEETRREVGEAAQRRVLDQHTYLLRMQELAGILRRELSHRGRTATASART